MPLSWLVLFFGNCTNWKMNSFITRLISSTVLLWTHARNKPSDLQSKSKFITIFFQLFRSIISTCSSTWCPSNPNRRTTAARLASHSIDTRQSKLNTCSLTQQPIPSLFTIILHREPFLLKCPENSRWQHSYAFKNAPCSPLIREFGIQRWQPNQDLVKNECPAQNTTALQYRDSNANAQHTLWQSTTGLLTHPTKFCIALSVDPFLLMKVKGTLEKVFMEINICINKYVEFGYSELCIICINVLTK